MQEWKSTITKDLKRRACEELSLTFDKVQMWDYFKKRKHNELEDTLHFTLDENDIEDNNEILLLKK